MEVAYVFGSCRDSYFFEHRHTIGPRDGCFSFGFVRAIPDTDDPLMQTCCASLRLTTDRARVKRSSACLNAVMRAEPSPASLAMSAASRLAAPEIRAIGDFSDPKVIRNSANWPTI